LIAACVNNSRSI